MEWLSAIGSVIGIGGSVMSGGLFGILGSVVGVFTKFLQEKQRQSWEKQKWEHEEKMWNLQMQARAQETENELKVVDTSGRWDGLKASLEADALVTSGAPSWVQGIRSLFRPFLTISLFIFVMIIFFKLMGALKGADSNLLAILSEAEIRELLKYIVYSVVFTAMAAGVWWFGDRAMTPESMKQANKK